MKKVKLKTYTEFKLRQYYNKPLRFKQLLEDSKKDERLSESAKSYYLARGEQQKADAFKTSAFNLTVENLENSLDKYAQEFKFINNQNENQKSKYRKSLFEYKESNSLTWYKMAALLETSRGNLSKFISGNDDVYSVDKLRNFSKKLQ